MRPTPLLPQLAGLIARLILAGTFVMAAVPKVLDPGGFTDNILSYRVVGPTVAAWAAIGLPWLELAAGFGTLIRPIRRASSLILSALLLTFIGLHLSAWWRGLDIDCGCFGGESETEYHWLLLRNLALLVIAIWATWDAFRNIRDRLPSQSP